MLLPLLIPRGPGAADQVNTPVPPGRLERGTFGTLPKALSQTSYPLGVVVSLFIGLEVFIYTFTCISIYSRSS